MVSHRAPLYNGTPSLTIHDIAYDAANLQDSGVPSTNGNEQR